jgi:hypothetical protein
MSKNFLAKFVGVNDDNKYLVEALKVSEITSRRVIGRGTLTVNANDIIKSESFRREVIDAAEIVKMSQR